MEKYLNGCEYDAHTLGLAGLAEGFKIARGWAQEGVSVATMRQRAMRCSFQAMRAGNLDAAAVWDKVEQEVTSASR